MHRPFARAAGGQRLGRAPWPSHLVAQALGTGDVRFGLVVSERVREIGRETKQTVRKGAFDCLCGTAHWGRTHLVIQEGGAKLRKREGDRDMWPIDSFTAGQTVFRRVVVCRVDSIGDEGSLNCYLNQSPSSLSSSIV